MDRPSRTVVVTGVDFINTRSSSQIFRYTATPYMWEAFDPIYDGSPYSFTFTDNTFGSSSAAAAGTVGYPTELVIEGAKPYGPADVEAVFDCGPMHVRVEGNSFYQSSLVVNQFIPAGSTITIAGNTFAEFATSKGAVPGEQPAPFAFYMLRLEPYIHTSPRTSDKSVGFDYITLEDNAFSSSRPHSSLPPDTLTSFVFLSPRGKLLGQRAATAGAGQSFPCTINLRRNNITRRASATAGVGEVGFLWAAQAYSRFGVVLSPVVAGGDAVVVEDNSIVFAGGGGVGGAMVAALYMLPITNDGTIALEDGGGIVVRRNTIVIGGGLIGGGGASVAAILLEEGSVYKLTTSSANAAASSSSLRFEGNQIDMGDTRDAFAFSLSSSQVTLQGNGSRIVVTGNTIVPPRLGALTPTSGGGAPHWCLVSFSQIFGSVVGAGAGLFVTDNTIGGGGAGGGAASSPPVLLNYGFVYVGLVRNAGDTEDFPISQGAVFNISGNSVFGGAAAVARAFASSASSSSSSGSSTLPADVGLQLLTMQPISFESFAFVFFDAMASFRSGGKFIIEGNAAVQAMGGAAAVAAAAAGKSPQMYGVRYVAARAEIASSASLSSFTSSFSSSFSQLPPEEAAAAAEVPRVEGNSRTFLPSSTSFEASSLSTNAAVAAAFPTAPDPRSPQSGDDAGGAAEMLLVGRNSAAIPAAVGALLIRRNIFVGVNGSLWSSIGVDLDTITLSGSFATFDVSGNSLYMRPTLVVPSPSGSGGGPIKVTALLIRTRVLSFLSNGGGGGGGGVRSAAFGMNANTVVVVAPASALVAPAAASATVSGVELIVASDDVLICDTSVGASSSSACSGAVLSLSGNSVRVSSGGPAAGIAVYSSVSPSGSSLRIGGSSKVQCNGNSVTVWPCEGALACGGFGSDPNTLPRISAFHLSFDYIGVSGSSVLTIAKNNLLVHTGAVGADAGDRFPILNSLRVLAGRSVGPTEPVAPAGGRGGALFAPAATPDGLTGLNLTDGSLFYLVDNTVRAEGRYFYKHLVAASLELGFIYAERNAHFFILRNAFEAIANAGLDDIGYNWYGPLYGIGLHISRTTVSLGGWSAAGENGGATNSDNLGTLHISENTINVDSLGDVTHGVVFGTPLDPTGGNVQAGGGSVPSIAAFGCSAVAGDRRTYHERMRKGYSLGGGAPSSSSSDAAASGFFLFPTAGGSLFERLLLSSSTPTSFASNAHGAGGPASLAPLCSGLYMYDNVMVARGATDTQPDRGGAVVAAWVTLRFTEGAQFHMVRNGLTYEDPHSTSAAPDWTVPRGVIIAPRPLVPGGGSGSSSTAPLCSALGAATTMAIANNSFTMTSSTADRFASICEGASAVSGGSGLTLGAGANLTIEFNTFRQDTAAGAALTATPIGIKIVAAGASDGWFSVQCNVYRQAVVTDYDSSVITQPSAVSEVKGCTLVITTTTATTTTAEPTTTVETTTAAATTTITTATTTAAPTTVTNTTTPTTTAATTTTEEPTPPPPPTITDGRRHGQCQMWLRKKVRRRRRKFH